MFRKLSIQSQILLIVVTSLLAATTLVSFFALKSTNRILRQEAIASVGMNASLRREALLAQLNSRRGRSVSILQMSDGICSVNPGRTKSCLGAVFEHFRHTNKGAGLQFLPTKGTPIALGERPDIFAQIPLPAENEVARFGRGSDGKVYFLVRGQTARGEIRVEFPIQQLESIFSSHEGLGDSGESFLTNESGSFLTSPLHHDVAGYGEPHEAVPLRACLNGQNGEALEPVYRGQRMVHGFRAVPEIGGGCIMVHMDETEAFAKSSKLAQQIVIVALLTLILAMILVLFASRLITRPIQRLAEYAQALQRGDFSQNMVIGGPAEIQTFARTFSAMAETLIKEIHDRERLQTESDRQKSQFEAIFNSISDGVMFVDLSHTIVMANPAFYEMFEFPIGTAVGTSARSIYSSGADFEQGQELLSTLDSVQGKVFGLRFKRFSGQTFASETMISRVCGAEGRAVGYIAIIRDIGSIKFAQAQLQQSEERFRRAVVDAPIPIMIRTEDGEVLEINKIWTEVTGYTRAEIPTIRDWTRKAYGDSADSIRQRISASAQAFERVDLGEFEITTKLGKKLLWNFIVAPLGELPDGRKIVISMANDITERKRAELELSKAVKSRDEFLATLSHELRTPMNIILGWLDILKAGNYDDALFRQAIETLSRNSKIQKDLIDDLLDVSRIISGKFHLNLELTDFSHIVRETCTSLKFRAEEKIITVKVDLPDQQLIVYGDSTKLTQVVTNILHNAFKFTPRNGSIHVRLHEQDGCVELCIQDSGIGIEPSFLDHVFDRLKQEDMGTTRAHSGLGLGLAISRHIVENHEGKIEVTSEGRDKGATFRVRLPLKKVQGNAVVSTTLGEEPLFKGSLQGLRALVVDDSPDILFLIRTWLEQEGVEVFEAESAAEGLKILQSSHPNVLLSDIGMPGEDGYQFIAHVRGLPGPESRTPAAALTAYAREEERARAMEAGFQTHIPKPTNKRFVLAAVKALLQGAP